MVSVLKNLIPHSLINVNRLSWGRFILPSANIYSDSFLKMDTYTDVRNRVKRNFRNNVDRFISDINKAVAQQSTIYGDDFKNYLHLVEDKPEQIDCLNGILSVVSKQNGFSSKFNYGPIIMRTILYLNKPDLALDLIKDKEFMHFFQDITSYDILFTSLLRSKMYQDVLEIYDLYYERHQKIPSSIQYATAVACLKLNTPESFEKLGVMMKIMSERNIPKMNKFMDIFAALALKQNLPFECLEIVSGSLNQNYYLSLNLTIEALCELDRVSECVSKINIAAKNISQFTPSIFKETLDKVNEKLQKMGKSISFLILNFPSNLLILCNISLIIHKKQGKRS